MTLNTKVLLLVVLAFLSLTHAADTNRCGSLAEDRTIYTEFYSASNGRDILQIHLNTIPTNNYTWNDILVDTYKWDTFDPELDGTVFIYDGVDERPRNVTIARRGGWSRTEGALPSLKVKFVNEDVDEWKNMDRLLLLKHPWDATRIMNKLSFEILQNVDNMASMYTQFVNLTVDGQPYGLYTLIEDLHKRMLKTHDLKKTSWLYKAESTQWSLIRDKVRDVTDPKYDEDAFELNWGIAGGAEDHSVLVNAYKKLWDMNLDNSEMFSTVFNVENFATWLAFQYLISNHDIQLSNYAIYAPKASDECPAPTPIYFMDWDHDSAWWAYHDVFQYGVDYAASTQGLQYFWYIRPVRRFLQTPEFVALLQSKMEYLVAGPLSPANIRAHTDALKESIRPLITVEPDLSNIAWDGTPETVNLNIDQLAQIPTKQLHQFNVNTKKRPMPIGLFDNTNTASSSLFFYWDKSFSLVNRPFYYEFAISKAAVFDETRTILTYKTNNTFAAIAASHFEPATTYYWRVIVRDVEDPTNIWMTALVNTSLSWGVTTFNTPAVIGALSAGLNVSITNQKVVDSRTYATLDNSDPAATSVACSEDPVIVPAGWVIAKNTPQVRADIASMASKWGSDNLVLADGTRVNSQTGAIVEGFGELAQHLIATVVQGDKLAYSANCTRSATNNRILITQGTDEVVDSPLKPDSGLIGTSSETPTDTPTDTPTQAPTGTTGTTDSPQSPAPKTVASFIGIFALVALALAL